jgi:hypothetical protein
MTLIDERPFDTVAEHDSPHVPAWDPFNAADLSIVTDGTAPKSPSNVMRETYPASFPDGSAHGATGFTFGGSYRTLYMSWWCKYSSNFQGHNSGVNKQWYIWTNDTEVMYFEVDGIGAGALTPQIVTQGTLTDGVWSPGIVPSAHFTRGAWDYVEVAVTGNTAGVANGLVDWYLNGVHVGSKTGLQFNAAATSWQQFDFNPVWGGSTGDTVVNEMYLDWDHFYISGKT